MAINDEFTSCETDVRIDGKVALVTGATSGIGLEVAKNFARRGAKVIIASRNQDKLFIARKEIMRSAGHDRVVARKMDFESLTSIRNFVNETMATEPRLDILVNNIGAAGLKDELTNDGLHAMMQVNYFGSFLLTFLLFPLLKSSAPSRIINVSSLALLFGRIDLDHLNDVGKQSNFRYYADAKLADVLFTVEMDKRIRGSDVDVYSVDPGLAKSVFFRNFEDGAFKKIMNTAILTFGRPLDRAATMPVYLAIDPKFQNRSGKHFRDCKEFYSSWFAEDTVLTRKLWENSKKLVQITENEDWETHQV